jgi:CTD kinase subunit beta
MAPVASPSERERVGPHPSYIEIAKPYILQTRIQKCLAEINMSDAKEDAVRLQGVAWIDQVRRALQLPIRTFNTAVIYYHKFRLLHSDNEYNWADASAAALFTACKIEDTLKKSREILCANWNLKVGPGESLSSDDTVCFPSKFNVESILTFGAAIRESLQAHHRIGTTHARERRLRLP